MPDILFVCTGNRCRSPIAEVLTWKVLRERRIRGTTDSAGTLDGGAPLPAETVRVLSKFGIDGTGRVSRRVTPDMAAHSALIVGMERAHVRAVALLDHSVWHRTFTLKEVVRRAFASGPRPFDEPLSAWAERLGAGREPSDMLGASGEDDIDDPMGAPFTEHERTASVIDALVVRLVDLAFPDGGA